MYDDIFNRFQNLSEDQQECLLAYMDFLIDSHVDDIVDEEYVIK